MTNQEIIARAFRMLGMKDAAESPDDVSDALSVLQSTILALPGATHWRDVVISAAYTAGENERIFAESGGPWVIAGPQRVESSRQILFCCDQYAVACEGYDDRPIKDGSRVQLLDGSSALTQMYRADIQAWVQASGLALTGTCPVNGDLEDSLAALLAVAMAPEFSAQPSPIVIQMAVDARSRMRARYGKRQDIAVDAALLRTSSNPLTSYSH
jgi:hypothetical protein